MRSEYENPNDTSKKKGFIYSFLSKKNIDEGNIVAEYLLLMCSVLFVPFSFFLLIKHVFNYFKLKDTHDGILFHYKNITKKIHILFGSVSIYILYFLIKADSDMPIADKVIGMLFLIVVTYLFVSAISGLKKLAKHEEP